MPRDSRPGPSPGWWNGVGVVLVILAIVIGVPLLSPRQETPVPEATPVPTSTPGRTITLDEFRAMLTDNPGEPPDSIVVDTPEGPVTVVVPETTTTTTTTAPRPQPTTTTTSTTTVPAGPVPSVGDLLDQLLGQAAPTSTTEVVGDAP